VKECDIAVGKDDTDGLSVNQELYAYDLTPLFGVDIVLWWECSKLCDLWEG
jgi:hypothetical protein